MTKVLTKHATKTEQAQLEEAYADILRSEKELDEMKKKIVEKVKSEMEKTGADVWGRFQKQQRISLGWNVADVREIFGKTWAEYMKPDASLLKAKMETEPRLAKCAIEKKTEAIVFKA